MNVRDAVADIPMDETFEGGGEETAAQRRAARGRKAVKLGIGGFFVRATRQRSVSAITDVQPAPLDANGTPRPSVGNDDDDPEAKRSKVRRARRPRKSQLEDCYPTAIQASIMDFNFFEKCSFSYRMMSCYKMRYMLIITSCDATESSYFDR